MEAKQELGLLLPHGMVDSISGAVHSLQFLEHGYG
jgi:hypothetical protein